MSIAKNSSSTENVDPSIVEAYSLLFDFVSIIDSQVAQEQKQAVVYLFEDRFNKLVGAVLKQPENIIADIRSSAKVAVDVAAYYGLLVDINDLLLPQKQTVTPTVGKTLVKTYTVYQEPANTSNVAVTTEEYSPVTITNTDVADDPTISLDQVVSDIVDEITVADIIASVSDTDLNYAQVSPETQSIVDSAASATTLEQGLTNISKNPANTIITNAKAGILYYTENNYANLNLIMAAVAADSALTAEFKLFKNAVGGGDGLSGAIAQLDNFKDHTDRISGLKLESEHEFASQSDDTATETFFYNNLPVGVPTIVCSFNAKYYRSAKYYIQATAGVEHQLTDFMVVHDNNIAYARVVNDVYTIDPYTTYTGVFSAGKINVYANTSLSNTNLVIYGTKIQIAKNSSSPEKMSQRKILEAHDYLTAYFRDGTNYAGLQSGSLSKGVLAVNLQIAIADAINLMSSAGFIASSTATKQQILTESAAAINTKSQALQDSIDADFAQYQLVQKKASALRIVNQLSTSYADPLAKSIVSSTTLDSVKEQL